MSPDSPLQLHLRLGLFADFLAWPFSHDFYSLQLRVRAQKQRRGDVVARHDDPFGATGSSALRFPKLFFPFCRFGLGDGDFQDYWLTFRNQRTLAAWQFAKERQFQPLHRRLDAPQGIAAHGNLVRGEDQSKSIPILLMN